MAEAGGPVSELLPLRGAVSPESPLTAQSQCDAPKTSTMTGGQEEPDESVGESCNLHQASPPTKEGSSSSLGAGGDPEKPYAEGRTVHSMRPALPVHRSHSDTSQPHPAHSQTHARAHGEGEAEGRSMLACKQPMQLQQCNIFTTVCCGAASGDSGAQQQPQTRCMCCSSPSRAAGPEVGDPQAFLPVKCDKLLCSGSYFHHANFEDTFAAYCHPQPIPAPSQLQPRLAGVEPAAPPPATNHLTLPRLISSVSETGLDGKHLLQCCNLSCSLRSLLPPAGQQTPKHFSGDERCGVHVGATSRDVGTMTAHRELRDVGVQTGQSDQTPHVFPQICLAVETSCSPTDTDRAGGKKAAGVPKSPVKEVKWDAEGMTWEVYGASVDPEELGLAIQKHLELQIKETASRTAKLSRQNTNASRQSGSARGQRKRSRIMSSFRAPACCARTTTTVD